MSEFSCDCSCRSQSAAAAHALSVIGQRLIDAANHPISPVSMETRSVADVQEGVGALTPGLAAAAAFFFNFVCAFTPKCAAEQFVHQSVTVKCIKDTFFFFSSSFS